MGKFSHDKVYTIVCQKDGRGIDNGLRTEGNPYMWPSGPHAPGHRWHIKHVEGEWYKIVSNQGKALDGGAEKVYLWSEHDGGHNHQWRFQEIGPKTYMIICRYTNKALDGNAENPFQWTPEHHNIAQHWIVRNADAGTKQKAFKAHKPYLLVFAKDGRALDSGLRTQGGQNPYMWPADGAAPGHRWHIKHAEGEFYKIVSGQGMALDAGAEKPYLWNEHDGGHNHQWKFVPQGVDRFLIVSRWTGKALGVHAESPHLVDAHHHPHENAWIIRKLH